MSHRGLVWVALFGALWACQSEPNDAGGPPADPSSTESREGSERPQDASGGPGEELAWRFVAEDYPHGAFFSGWAGAEDVWLVGGQFETPLVAQYQGDTWTHHDPGTGHQVWWVHGFKQGPIFVVGDGGSIARYEGGVWETMPTNLPGVTLYGVWGASPDDLWAVGGPFSFGESGPPVQGPTDEEKRRTDVLLHYDGVSWEMVSLPELPERSSAAQSLFKVWGTSADDVYVVGGGRLILHYDGVSWRVQDAGEGSQQLFTVAGRGADDVWAVGGGATPVLLRQQGEGWSEVELPDFTPQIIQGLWTAPGEPVTISGFGGFSASLWEGEWTVHEPITTDPLHGVVGDSTGALWAAGGSIVALSKYYTGSLIVRGRSVAPLVEGGGADRDASGSEEPRDTSDIGPSPDTSEPDAEPAPQLCGTPMTSCPPNQPGLFVGAPCEGEDLLCSYEIMAGGEYWHFSCVEGRWHLDVECLAIGGACGVLPPSEACLGPHENAPLGMDFDIGPATSEAAFTPFTPGQEVSLSWGGQGAPMLEFRLKVDDDEAPQCLSYHMSAELSAGTNAEASGTVRTRCGESLAMYIILPLEVIDCDTSMFDVQLTLTIEGLGERVYTLSFQGGGGCFG